MLTCPNCGRESPEDFAFCPACASPLTPAAPAREIRKTVTVVFCDVSGSTALGERLDPESLRDVQSRYFDTMRWAIERHGGTVEKYIGDAVMAVFGIPQLHEDDALRAARAAVDMREGLAALNKELERDRGVTIEVRIGVNTGEVVAGDPAAGQALVTGDAVNVAARLEQHAPPGEVLLGEATHRLVREAVEVEPVAPLEAKGKADPVAAWRLLAVREVSSAVPRHLDSPMVGRERQLAQLRQAFDAAVEDRACQLFTILGPAGVGKSRLAEEFLGGVAAEATILRGRCLPYGEGITYFPVVEAIKQAAGLADFDLPEVVETKVCSVLQDDEHQELVCRHVSQLMGIGEAAAGEETFWAIRRFFEAVARERRLVLVLDDIHWGEPTFLDLVEHVADWSRGSSILLLCMARPELLDARSTWGGGKLNAATVSLEPLDPEQAERLIENLLGRAELPPAMEERIVRTAEGNPLFVEETVAMLIDDGRLVKQEGRWVATADLAEVAVPPSIQALLAARLDQLTAAEREVLEAAAVVGKEFHLGAVWDLVADDGRADVRSHLMALVRRELVRPERTSLPGEDAFRFRHILIRDAAYDAIPKSQRVELHERFAGWLERVAGDAIAEQEEIVAYHLEQAHAYRLALGPPDERSTSLGERAASHLASAGRRASARGDSVAAANLFRRALVLGPADGRARARVLLDLGEAWSWIGDVREGAAVLEEAVEVARTVGDRALEWLARIRLSAARMLIDPIGTPTDHVRLELEEAIGVFEQLHDAEGLATAWTQLGGIGWMPCRFADAERAARRALEHARRTGDERLLSATLITLLSAQMFGSATPEEGRRTLEELRDDIARTRRLESFAKLVGGRYLAMDGEIDRGRDLIDEAIAISSALGLRFIMAADHEELGDVEMRAGNLEAAVDAYRRNYEILDALGDEGHRSTAAANLARPLCKLGRLEEAASLAEIAMTVAPDDDVASQAVGRSAHALVRSARGDHAEAERAAREAVRIYLDAGAQAPQFVGDAWMDLAVVMRAAKKSAEAVEAAREALALFEGKGDRVSAASVRAFLDELGANV